LQSETVLIPRVCLRYLFACELATERKCGGCNVELERAGGG